MADVALSRAVRWEPRREYILELDRREDVEAPFLHAARTFDEKDSRADEIRSRLYGDAAQAYVRKLQEYSATIGTAHGEDRTGQDKMLDRVTEEMEEAQAKLPELGEEVKQARERCEALEEEYREIRRWQGTNFDPLPIRRTSLPKLPDRQEEMKKYGRVPSPSELDRQARRMGTASTAD